MSSIFKMQSQIKIH